MINAEKYLKEGVDIKEFSRNMFNYLVNRDEPLKIKIENYLQEDIKPTLTEDEKVILRNIDRQNFKAIGRKDDYLYLRYTDYCFEYGETDIKSLTFWYMYHNLFQFIKERGRIRNS